MRDAARLETARMSMLVPKYLRTLAMSSSKEMVGWPLSLKGQTLTVPLLLRLVEKSHLMQQPLQHCLQRLICSTFHSAPFAALSAASPLRCARSLRDEQVVVDLPPEQMDRPRFPELFPLAARAGHTQTRTAGEGAHTQMRMCAAGEGAQGS